MTATLIYIVGWLFIPLGALHLIFPRYFDWKRDLANISLINRQVMEVHTLFIGVTVALMGCLCVSSSSMLVETPLGRRVCLGLMFFWGIRLVVQFCWFSSKLWKGKRFETFAHVAFSLFWAVVTVLFGWIGFGAPH